jgi:hypothetical protein
MEKSVSFYGSSVKNRLPGLLTKNGRGVAKYKLYRGDVLSSIKEEGGKNFFEFFNEIGVFQLKNILVLSSQHHFFFDYEKVQASELIINFNLANKIHGLQEFVGNLNRMMPMGKYYVGCFNDQISEYKSFLESKPNFILRANFSANSFIHKVVPSIPLFKHLYYFSTNGQTKRIAKRDVEKLFKLFGFKMITTTTADGKTFFMVQKVQNLVN